MALRDMERLPAGTPLALTGAGLLLLGSAIVFFHVSGGDEAWMGTAFVAAGVGILLVPLSRPGALRTIGLVLAIVLATAPVWWFLAGDAVGDLRAPNTQTSIQLAITPEDENAAYTVLVPAPAAWRETIEIEPWQQRIGLVEEDGALYLLVQGRGPFTTGLWHDWGNHSEAFGAGWWREADWQRVEVRESGSALLVEARVEGSSRWCGGTGHLIAWSESTGAPRFGRAESQLACQ